MVRYDDGSVDATALVLCFLFASAGSTEATNPVIEMARSTSASLIGSEFNDFLFAPVGEDGNNTLLSVLSALARLDLDPWQEAAKLARLPVDAANQRLASLIGKLPNALASHWDAATIAARLIALLPRRSGAETVPPGPPVSGVDALAGYRILVYVALMALILAAVALMANHQTPPTVGGDPAPITDTPATPPATPGQ